MMRKLCLRILIAFFSVAVCGMVAKGQVQNPIALTVGHPFVVAGKTLPAGTYTVKRASDANPKVLIFSSLESHSSAIVLPIWGGGGYADNASVTFVQIEGQYFLNKIETANGVFTIPMARSAIVQAAAQNGTSTSGSTGQK
jgi:hypothetical protein